jgi:hypothetical protein
MRTIFALALALASLLAPLSAAAQASPQTATFGDLVERGKELDGREVVFEGEAIGDPMRRGDHAWVNVLDPGGAIGVWMEAEAAAGIGRFGSYRGSGDRLRIRGVYHRACPEHGGDLDIHAASVEVLAPGRDRPRPVNRLELLLLAPSFALALALFLLWRRREAAIRRAGR